MDTRTRQQSTKELPERGDCIDGAGHEVRRREPGQTEPQEVWAFGQEASLSCSVPPAHARADGPAQGLGSHPRLLVEPLGDFPPNTAQSLALFAGLL